MALPAAFLEELRARTPLPALVGRRVKLARSGRNWKGCCPFHGEKSPSFYVYDDHFHCFGCGAHGDAISFTMQIGGSGFRDAVESLAAEAGLDVPKPSPEAARAEQMRIDLHGVLDAALSVFACNLSSPGGQPALRYLRGRGLGDETIAQFGLGWSGDGRGALTAELGRQGITPDQMLAAGLLREADQGGAPPREQFYGRVMFPIRDRRGRVISFGGRILGDGQPKYVNGPETAIFLKRHTLYGLDQARAALRDGAKLLVVEGYLDVIALHQAGFGGAVAPLGTALTEDHLAELWRSAPLPMLCFDGDAAGQRAALRAMELALPSLAPDRSLQIARLPEGEDPDSLIRSGGAAAFDQVAADSRPLAEALFHAIRAGKPVETPEQRAALRARLNEAAQRIPDRILASEYRQDFHNRIFAQQRRRKIPVVNHGQAFGDKRADQERLRILAAVLLRHPDLIHDVEEAWCRLRLAPPHDGLRHEILDWAGTAQTLDSATLLNHLDQCGLADLVTTIFSSRPVPLPVYAAPDAMPAAAEQGWWHLYGLLGREGLDEDVAAALRFFTEHREDEAAYSRLVAVSAARQALRGGEQGTEL